MESFFVRFKNALVLIVVLLAQTIGLAIQVRRPAVAASGGAEPDGRQVYLLRYWATAAVTPFELLARRTGGLVRGTWNNYLDLRHTHQQNAELQRQIAQLRLEQAAFAEDAIQGHRLQALLDFQQHYVAKTIAAQVIGTSGSDLSRMLLLDKGSLDGLKPDMAVITPDGIVGKLRDVFPHTAQLLLLNDPTAGAGVVLQSSRIRAIVRGTPTGRLQISNLTPDARIKPGETVLTSGGDLVYPRGLPVGTIESVAPDPDHQPYTAILLKPAANLFQLEEVLIITETQTAISAQARQDLAQGAATAAELAAQAAAQAAQAAESRRAADLLADRLPSLQDADSTDPASGSPAATKPADPNAPAPAAADQKPVPIVPRPLPTLHPDHYTPGTTPPAADLTPGARSAPAPQTAAPPAALDPSQPAAAARKKPKAVPPPDDTTGTPTAPPATKPATNPNEEPPR